MTAVNTHAKIISILRKFQNKHDFPTLSAVMLNLANDSRYDDLLVYLLGASDISMTLNKQAHRSLYALRESIKLLVIE